MSRATGWSRSVTTTSLPERTARMYWPSFALSLEELVRNVMPMNVHEWTRCPYSLLVPGVLHLAQVGFAERSEVPRLVVAEELEDLLLVRPDLADGAGLPVLERLVTVAHAAVAALGLQVRADLRDGLHDLAPHERHHVADLPLGAPAQPQIGDVEQLREVHHHLEVRRRGVREHEAGILGGDPLLEGELVDAGDLLHQAVVDLPHPGRLLPGLGRHVLEPVLLVLHVALGLLLEADADPVAHELMGERARHAGDAEPEDHLLERRGVARLEALLDEVADRLGCDT